MEISLQNYKHYGRCLCLTNGTVEIKCALLFGIRVLYFALAGKENIFYEQPADAEYLCTPEGWRVFAGHRLWLAPEHAKKTYWPDNLPVTYRLLPDGVELTQPQDEFLNVQKSLRIEFVSEDPQMVTMCHTVRNTGDKPVEGAVWTVSAMARSAVLHVPFQSGYAGASPNRVLSFWRNTSPADPRISFSDGDIRLTHTSSNAYFKLGIWCERGMAVCRSRGQRFEKRFSADREKTYPDGGVNLEVYICPHMMEFETLGALTTIAPDGEESHTEYWRLAEEPAD